ncbi:MAG: hypothetical protein U9Q07_10180, partial [Planctomycetota bacterium]|nr:hypothetical protein [Planctomycetota bacterium]
MLVSPNDRGVLESVAAEGDYSVEEVVAVLNTDVGKK